MVSAAEHIFGAYLTFDMIKGKLLSDAGYHFFFLSPSSPSVSTDFNLELPTRQRMHNFKRHIDRVIKLNRMFDIMYKTHSLTDRIFCFQPIAAGPRKKVKKDF